MKSLKRLVCSVILAFFIISPVTAAEENAANLLNAKDLWYSALMQGMKVGWMHVSTAEAAVAGENLTTIKTEQFVSIKRGDFALETKSVFEYTFNSTTGRVKKFSNESSQSGQEKTVVQGEAKDGKLVITNKIGDGKPSVTEMPEPEKYSTEFETELNKAVFKEGLKIGGKAYSVETQSSMDITMEVIEKKKITWMGRELEPWVVKMEMGMKADKIKITMLMLDGPEKITLNVDLAGGTISMRLTSEKDAKNLDSNFDSFAQFSIKVKPPVLESENVREATAIFKGHDPDSIPQSAFQKKIEVTKDGGEKWKLLSPTLPENEALTLPIDPKGVEEYAKATVYIQSGDDAIKKKAAEIVGDEKNSLKALRKISDWVYKNIKDKNYSIAFATAAQTLKSLEGDCTEHSLLTIALARTAGIPARAAVGLGFSGKSFEYHMWVEGYVAKDTWIPVDPALGQIIPDAFHIKLHHGDVSPETQFELSAAVLGVLGKLQVEILDVKQVDE
jgi:hypothetical protein